MRLPRDIAGRLEGRSSLGRLGLQVHATAGFVDPGFEGILTFELINSGKLPVRVFPGMRLGQICFFRVPDVQALYQKKRLSKYAGGLGVVFTQIQNDPEIFWDRPDAAADSPTNE
jgi:dCTP deaminase